MSIYIGFVESQKWNPDFIMALMFGPQTGQRKMQIVVALSLPDFFIM